MRVHDFSTQDNCFARFHSLAMTMQHTSSQKEKPMKKPSRAQSRQAQRERPPRPGRPNLGAVDQISLLTLASACLFLVPMAFTLSSLLDDPLAGLPPTNEGAFEGGVTGTETDTAINSVIPESQLESGRSFDIPTGGKPTPLFGAQKFTQKLLLFEEFGTQSMPQSYSYAISPLEVPMPVDEFHCPDSTAVDAYLAQPLYPEPYRTADTAEYNPWQPLVERFLGRPCPTPPADGRPDGEGWSHQRWQEFPPQVYFQSCLTGSKVNGGFRDSLQRHGYAAGEFGPGGLYHNTAGVAATEGTTAGIEIRFHPRMPVQQPDALWTFDGTLPPKLLNVRYGESVLFRNYNCLPVDPSANRGFGLHTITTHEHNGHNPAESDGYANAFFFPGQYYDYHWPLILAGYDTVNTAATDPRAGRPDGNGGITPVRGDYRETMSTHWFHDHMLDYTAQNVYKGNAAMMNYYSAIDRGNEAIDDGVNLRLPSGTALDWGNRDYDVNLVIADKATTRDGQLWFNIFNKDGFLGDMLTTNFLYAPTLDVRARKYRFRILNGCVSRYLKVALVDQNGNAVPFHLIANDGNIMEHSVAFDGSLGTTRGILPTQGIAERFDIIVDFSAFRAGDKLYFVNLMEHTDGQRPNRMIPLRDALGSRYRPRTRDNDRDGIADEWRDGDPCVGKFLEFVVQSYAGQDLSMNPADYVAGRQTMIPLPHATAAELAAAPRHTFEFGRSGGTDGKPWTVKTDGGDAFTADMRRVSAAPNMGDLTSEGLGHLEVWTIRNGGNGWSHPVHVHFEEGIILSKDGQAPPEWERWARKDLYRVGGEVDSCSEMEIAIRIREFAGTYMEHCHNTQHEDNAMLLRWDSERPGQLTTLTTPMPTWDGVNSSPSLALATARTGDGGGGGGGGGGGTTPVVADAGGNQTVTAGSPVQLDGSGSTGPVGFTYLWTHDAGSAITLSDATIANPTFTAPSSVPTGGVDIHFTLTVTDPATSTSTQDTATVHVDPVVTQPQDVVSIADARYRISKRFWRASGSATVLANQAVTVYLDDPRTDWSSWNAANPGSPPKPRRIGSATVGSNGSWSMQFGNGSAVGNGTVPGAGDSLVWASSNYAGGSNVATFTFQRQN